MEKISTRLAEALKTRGMTAAELARKSGVDKGSISNYLKNKFIPKQFAIGAMAKALNVSPAWLMGYDVTMDGEELIQIEFDKLNELNKAKLMAYYQALLDTQEG